jgi:hypothetical protein
METDKLLYCEKCKRTQVFTCSGTGNKCSCQECGYELRQKREEYLYADKRVIEYYYPIDTDTGVEEWD